MHHSVLGETFAERSFGWNIAELSNYFRHNKPGETLSAVRVLIYGT